MIKGDLYFRIMSPTQNNPISIPISNSINLPIWCAQPWIDVEIEIPSLSVKRIFTMLMDTGADGTVLNLRDAVSVLSARDYDLLKQSGNIKTSIGVGGSACYYKINAKIIFQHADGLLEGYSFELAIAKPDEDGAKRVLQLRVPSILGRDLLCQFRMIMDYSKQELFLEH